MLKLHSVSLVLKELQVASLHCVSVFRVILVITFLPEYIRLNVSAVSSPYIVITPPLHIYWIMGAKTLEVFVTPSAFKTSLADVCSLHLSICWTMLHLLHCPSVPDITWTLLLQMQQLLYVSRSSAPINYYDCIFHVTPNSHCTLFVTAPMSGMLVISPSCLGIERSFFPSNSLTIIPESL